VLRANINFLTLFYGTVRIETVEITAFLPCFCPNMAEMRAWNGTSPFGGEAFRDRVSYLHLSGHAPAAVTCLVRENPFLF
jgi:hypothetical protein